MMNTLSLDATRWEALNKEPMKATLALLDLVTVSNGDEVEIVKNRATGVTGKFSKEEFAEMRIG
jgi:hypothetical protein